MRPGQASRTAVMVCAGRALADGRLDGFRDPTAMTLLPDDERRRVQAVRDGVRPRGIAGRLRREWMRHQASMMAVRTSAIDNAIREADLEQVVILGAGLDGRAWRMPLGKVFEVDHPDTQKEKRERVGVLEQQAREVHFVPVDFTRDDLGDRLQLSGHDASQPTMWIWEGVVMYLTLEQIEATLSIIRKRSAAGSRLVVLYHQQALIVKLLSPIFARVGEPLRSHFSQDQMKTLLARHGFAVRWDRSTPDLALTPALRRATQPMYHLRIAEAVREGM